MNCPLPCHEPGWNRDRSIGSLHPPAATNTTGKMPCGRGRGGWSAGRIHQSFRESCARQSDGQADVGAWLDYGALIQIAKIESVQPDLEMRIQRKGDYARCGIISIYRGRGDAALSGRAAAR